MTAVTQQWERFLEKQRLPERMFRALRTVVHDPALRKVLWDVDEDLDVLGDGTQDSSCASNGTVTS